MLLLYTLLVVAPLHGAEIVRPQAPVQLSFAFAAPMPVLPLAALTPVPSMAPPMAAALPTAAPVLAAPVPALAPDAVAVAPQSTPVSPEAEEIERTDGRSQLQSLSRNGNGDGHAFDSPKRKTKMDYEEFGRQLAATPGLDMNAFRHTDAKRRILAASGYTHLYGAGGVRIPLSQAADVRIGNAFLSVKKTFDRRPR